jgi:Ca2+-binding EF-hand superfamily protein
MVGRTVVIGDIPWVSQCADAFLSKIFARSYSIAGLNVLSGNPSDHLVHRHTHRIVRGSLLICGRPDGRLTALTSAECSVNLSVNQASSIQSLGGTCESITIGHNPSKLQLTKMDIFLGTHRPKFLCEQILDVIDDEMARKQHALAAKVNAFSDPNKKGFLSRFKGRKEGSESGADDHSILNRSSHSLKGAYLGLREKSEKDQLTASTRMITTDISEKNDKEITGSNGSSGHESAKDTPVVDTSEFMDVFEPRSKEDRILEALIAENNKTKGLRPLFDRIDTNGDGTLDLEEFIAAYQEVNPGLSATELEILFHEGKKAHHHV